MHTSKRFLLLTCWALCGAFALTARADYFGLEIIDRSDLIICQNTSEEITHKLDVCEVHVIFDDSLDRLISVAFTNVSTTDPAGFFQHSEGGNTAPPCPLIPIYPSVVCDSFVTVGVECDAGGSSTDPDFDSSKFNNDGEVVGGWFNTAPSNSQGAPDANGRVMVGRFSYKQNKTTSGDVCIFARVGGEVVEFLLEPFDCSNPGLQGGGSGGPPAGTICYVDDDEDPANDCLGDWGDACPDLQTALIAAAAEECNQIWVAEGTYLPSDCSGTCVTADRSDSFQLIDDVSLYGGFPNGGGDETFGARNPAIYISALSGDIDENDEPLPPGVPDFPGCDFEGSVPLCTMFNGLNSYHVVDGSGTASSALLDGFYITAGLADADAPDDRGAGIYVLNGSPTIRDCTLAVNIAATLGGGIHLETSNAIVEQDCCIAHNLADVGGGGGISISGGAPTIQDSTILLNNAFVGGGITSGLGSPIIRSNLILKNWVVGAPANNPRGGGISLNGEGLGTTLVEDNTIKENTGNSAPACISICTAACNGTGGIKGAGMYVEDATVTNTEIRDNIFEENENINFEGKGGAMYLEDSSPRVEGNFFDQNRAVQGGGMFNSSSHPLVVDCEFRHNGRDALDLPITEDGGGIYNDLSNPGIYNSRFVDNVARGLGGGAIYNSQSDPTIVNTLFVDNDAPSSADGGAIIDGAGSSSTIRSCTFYGNTADDEGGALFSGGGTGTLTDMANNIMWGNSATTGSEIFVSALSTVDVDFSDAQGGQAAVGGTGTVNWGDGSIGEDPVNHDPKFSAPTEEGFVLLAGSAGIDSGLNSGVPAGVTTDLDGLPRFVQDLGTIDCPHVPDPSACGDPPIVDMGAHEAQDCGDCPTDVNGDGQTNATDLAHLLGNWGPLTNGGARCLDGNDDGQINASDLAILLGAWGPC